MKPITTTKLMLVFAVIGLVSLQLSSMQCNSFSGNNNNSEHRAFALTNGQPISQKLNYAHFLPLTNNSKLHQVASKGLFIPPWSENHYCR